VGESVLVSTTINLKLKYAYRFSAPSLYTSTDTIHLRNDQCLVKLLHAFQTKEYAHRGKLKIKRAASTVTDNEKA